MNTTSGVVQPAEGSASADSPAKERVVSAWFLDGLRHRIRDLIDEFNELMGTEMEARQGGLDRKLDRLRKLEGGIDVDVPGIRISNRKTGGKGPAWLIKMVMAVCVILVAQGILGTVAVVVTVASMKTRIESYIESNNKRMDMDEQAIRDAQRRLDRGAGMDQSAALLP